MPAASARHVKIPKFNITPRIEVDASLQSRIDATLKAARACAQRVAPLETCLQDEMRILERLYYKGVNQHRMALFWRRVEEVRRLGRRMLDAQMATMIDDLRYSFYVQEGTPRNPKILRGAWSQMSDAKFLNFVYDRTVSLIELVTVTKERLAKAFHSLSLMMQTGAFLQLIVTLTAVVCRINTITEELGEALQSLSDALYILHEAMGLKRPKLKKSQTVQKKVHAPKRALEESSAVQESMGEDLGSTVVRRTPSQATESSKTVYADVSPAEAISSFWKQGGQLTAIEQSSTLEVPSLIISKATPSNEGTPSTTGALKETKRKFDSTEGTKVKKKKKKRKDEIDHIFSSL